MVIVSVDLILGSVGDLLRRGEGSPFSDCTLPPTSGSVQVAKKYTIDADTPKQGEAK
jgi:hypothetical protein